MLELTKIQNLLICEILRLNISRKRRTFFTKKF